MLLFDSTNIYIVFISASLFENKVKIIHKVLIYRWFNFRKEITIFVKDYFRTSCVRRYF